MPPPKLDLGSIWLPCLILLVFWARPTAAFGAGNIASTSGREGQNWRHGDIEDTLLTLLLSTRTGKKFTKMDVKRVYFGNWLRDYSQAVDVGTVKMVSAEAIRILLWVLGFLSFGYGTKEFEVTRDRLGCYRPEEHIDNPKDYADNLDARQYDRRLRGPVDERRELAIDQRTGLKTYIASEDKGITTSAGMVRDLLRRSIDLARRSRCSGPDFYEALRLLGTATHCLEDYAAHSNYVELALQEIEGDQDTIFAHVGAEAKFEVDGARAPIYPIVTGTFGGVDFLHSVCGEISDKATQSELQELEGAINDADRKKNKSQIKELLSQLPDGIFCGNDEGSKADELEQNSQAAQMGNMRISPKEPEEFTQQIDELVKQIYPIMEFHDEIMHSISEFIESIPVLPDLIEQVQEQINIFVFSLLAPFVLPIIDQVKTELETGSSEVIASSREKQHIVWNDPYCTDPTHSMLSKDHFSNILNEPAGRVASETLKWVIPQVVACWDGEADPERTIDTIIEGVFHHPALVNSRDLRNREATRGREIMFGTVKRWWDGFNESQRRTLRGKLSSDGVREGKNHEGEHDRGHGCGKPLGMANDFAGLGGKGGGNAQIQQVSDQAGKLVGEAVGGGELGGMLGKMVGGIGGQLLGDAFGGAEQESRKSEGYDDDGSYSQTSYAKGHHKKKSRDDTERWGEARLQETQYEDGGRRQEYQRHERDDRGGSYGYSERVETSGYTGGGYEQRSERRYESGNQWQSEQQREGFNRSGEYYNEEKKKKGKKHDSEEEEESGDEDDWEKRQKKERKKREKEEKKRQKQYSRGSGDEDSDEEKKYKRHSNDYQRESSPKRRSGEYGGGYSQDRRHGDTGYSDQTSSYGQDSYTSGGYSGGRGERGYGGGDSYRQETTGYQNDSYSSGGGYGGQQSSEYSGQQRSEYGQESYGESNYGSNRGYEGRRNDDEEDGGGRQQYSSGGYSGGYGGDEYGRRY